MGTGLKKFARKTIYNLKYPGAILPRIPSHQFPHEPSPEYYIRTKMNILKDELVKRDVTRNIGSLYTLPHSAATNIYKQLIDLNPGNLGRWTDDESKTSSTTKIEYEVIHKLIELYHGDHSSLTGYVTTGGTEGNIFTMWSGVKFLEQYCPVKSICVLKSSLTHYSVHKAGDICRLPQYIVPLNNKTWNIDSLGFTSTIQSLHKKGFRGFILPLTLGYTSTGTSDDIAAITRKATEFEKNLPGTKFFIWIDAALNGLILPFLKDTFLPFHTPLIQALVVDFHKFGMVPYPAGVVLFNKLLAQLIENPIDYLAETDSTLLGSRSGIPAASIWIMMHTLGKKGYKNIAKRQLSIKRYFISQLTQLFPTITVITQPSSLTCGVIFHNFTHQRLHNRIEDKYSLYPGKTDLVFYPRNTQTHILYKFFFLPHMNMDVIKELLSDLRHAT